MHIFKERRWDYSQWATFYYTPYNVYMHVTQYLACPERNIYNKHPPGILADVKLHW